MVELLQATTNWLVILFALTGMASLGLSLEFEKIVAPLRNGRLVLATLVTNFLLAPLFAIVLLRVFPLERDFAHGLLLLSGAAGAPFLPKLVALARGDVSQAVGVMVLQMLGTILVLPLALPWLIEGLEVDAWAIAQPLLLLMLLPLILGQLARRYLLGLSARLNPVLVLVSNLSLLAVAVLLLGLNVRSFLAVFGSGAAFVGLLFVLLCVVAGAVVGRVHPNGSGVLAIGTGQRNIAAALVIATSNQMSADVVVMLLLTTFAGLIVLLGTVQWYRSRSLRAVVHSM